MFKSLLNVLHGMGLLKSIGRAIQSPDMLPKRTKKVRLGINIGPRSWQYGPSTARSVQERLRTNIPQYGPEQVKLVSSLLYGIVIFLVEMTLLVIQAFKSISGSMLGNSPAL